MHAPNRREEQEARRQRELEEKKREKLLNTKVPIGKPTNAAILKAEKVLLSLYPFISVYMEHFK